MGANSGLRLEEAWSCSATPSLNKSKIREGSALSNTLGLLQPGFRKDPNVVSLSLEVAIILDVYSAGHLPALTPSGMLAGSQALEEKGVRVYCH